MAAACNDQGQSLDDVFDEWLSLETEANHRCLQQQRRKTNLTKLLQDMHVVFGWIRKQNTNPQIRNDLLAMNYVISLVSIYQLKADRRRGTHLPSWKSGLHASQRSLEKTPTNHGKRHLSPSPRRRPERTSVSPFTQLLITENATKTML